MLGVLLEVAGRVLSRSCDRVVLIFLLTFQVELYLFLESPILY